MASFDMYSNFKDNAGVTSVVFGSEKPVLEVELNEMQDALKSQMRRVVKNILGDGISDLSKITYANGIVSVASGCFLSLNGYVANCTGLSITASNNSVVYLQSWEETVDYSTTLKTEGNQQSSSTVANWAKDSRSPVETSRRKVMKYTLSTSQDSSKYNLAIAKIGADGLITRLCREVSYYKLSEQVIDLTESVGEISGAIGFEADLENNTVKRVGDNEFWKEGADYNQNPIYAKRVRCNVTDDGVVVAVLGDEAYTDTGALTVAVEGTDGKTYPIGTKVQSLVYQPKYYFKRVPIKLVKQATNDARERKGFHLYKFRDLISYEPKVGFKVHPAFKLPDGTELDGYFVGQYDGCIYDVSANTYDLTDGVTADFTASTGDKFSSIAGAKPASGKTNDLTRTKLRTLCNNRGTGYQQLDLAIASSEQTLFVVEYGTFNVQATELGAGITNITDNGTDNMSISVPPDTSLGNGSGTIAVTVTYGDKTYNLNIPVFRGVCNFYGNLWSFVDGFLRANSTVAEANEAMYALGNFIEAKSGYTGCGFSMSYTESYVKAFGYSPECDFTYLTSLTGGDSSRPVGDYHWTDKASLNYYIARLGAAWYFGARSGFFCWGVSSVASGRRWDFGGRLCRKGAFTVATDKLTA